MYNNNNNNNNNTYNYNKIKIRNNLSKNNFDDNNKCNIVSGYIN